MANKDDRSIAHVPSGIAGLDAVLQGGFLQGGLYIIQGTPGVGKTILGNQICFDHVAKDARALYVTLLAENHARMLLHMRQLGFFDDKRIPKSLSYISGFRALEEEGLKGLLTLVRREIQAHDASVLVIDGLVAAHESAPSDYEFKKFIHELQTLAGALGCTMFLLTSAQSQFISPEHTMVDGLISLTDELHGGQAIRHLEVQKFRGSGYLRGRHAFRITSAGITVFPRIESIYNHPKHDHPNGTKRVSSGVKKLDTMLGGGFPAATTTMVSAPRAAARPRSGCISSPAPRSRRRACYSAFTRRRRGCCSRRSRSGSIWSPR
jgi:circadian clock protein KaiC